MILEPIKTDKEYAEWLDWVDKAFERKVEAGSKDGEMLQAALLLIKNYEDKQHPVPKPDSIS
jgi:HTH-type transcriptional regulator / antitoxin HigA